MAVDNYQKNISHAQRQNGGYSTKHAGSCLLHIRSWLKQRIHTNYMGAVTGGNQETPTTYVHNNTMRPTNRHSSLVDTIIPHQNESHEDSNQTK